MDGETQKGGSIKKPGQKEPTSTSPVLLNDDCLRLIFEFVGFHSKYSFYAPVSFDFEKIENEKKL